MGVEAAAILIEAWGLQRETVSVARVLAITQLSMTVTVALCVRDSCHCAARDFVACSLSAGSVSSLDELLLVCHLTLGIDQPVHSAYLCLLLQPDDEDQDEPRDVRLATDAPG